MAGFWKRFFKEIDEAFWQRWGPQGASELGHAINAGSAYVPYGPGNRLNHVHGDGELPAVGSPEFERLVDKQELQMKVEASAQDRINDYEASLKGYSSKERQVPESGPVLE